MPDDDRYPVRVHIVYSDGEEDLIDLVVPDQVVLVTGVGLELTHRALYANGTVVLTLKAREVSDA